MKKIIATILSIAVICGCAGCESGNNIFSAVDEEVLNFVDEPSNVNTNVKKAENGYYFTDINGMKKIRYYDLESGIAVPLCNKPECDHDYTSNCNSSSAENGFTICGDYIYYTVSRFKDDVAEADLFRTALDGSSRTKLATGCAVKIPEGTSASMTSSYMVVHKGKIIFSYSICVGGTAKQHGVVEYDMSTGALKEILSSNDDEFNVLDFVGIGDAVYFSYNRDLMKYDLNTKKLVMLSEDKCWMIRSDGEYLYTERGGTTFKVDPETGEDIKLVYEGKIHLYCGTYAIYNGYFIRYFLSDDDESSFTVFNENREEIISTNVSELVKNENISQDKLPLMEVGVENGELIIVADGTIGEGENEEYVTLVFGCNFENYINGTEKPELIFTATF